MIQHLLATATAGNVNTDFLVPAASAYRILYGQIVLTTDATVANRRVLVQSIDSDSNVVFDTHAGAVVAASQTSQHHEIMQGIYRETSFIGSSLQVPIPIDFVLDAGWSLRVSIENGVAGDSYTVDVVASELHLGAF